MKLHRTILLTLFLGWAALTAGATGLTWPATQYLPTFSKPAADVDCIDLDSLPVSQQALFSSLEGIVNRTQPRIACVSSGGEGEFTWVGLHGLSYVAIDGFTAILDFKTNVTGLVVNDPAQPDTLNLATSIAGVKNELICDPSLLSTLTNAPYSLPVVDDLRGMFSNKYQVYGYLYTNYWPLCTHRIVAGLETNCYWNLRDYLIAVKSAVVWLDPHVSADAAALAPFISNMAPVGGIYLGWWPDEGDDMQWIAQYGIPVIASDFFCNGTVYGGVTTPISIPAIPPCPPLLNKVYVSLILSDGDNVQYMQHAMKINWGSSARGTVPIGWTVQPLSADLDPGMLNYYWSTATSNDCLVSGPSGGGYTRINYWSAGNVSNYARASSPYLQRTGIRVITVWLTVSGATGNTYAADCPSLLGVTDQNGGYYTTHDGVLPVIGLPGSASYSSAVSNLVYGITNTAGTWNGSSPMFLAVQGSAWDITPANCQTVAASVDTNKYVFVRPDQLFLLYQQSAGLGKGGAAPYVAVAPASQSTGVGSNVTFTVTASGTSSLSYQWLFNGSALAGKTGAVCALSDVQLTATGNYSVVVTNNYGAVTSSVAALTFGNQPLGFNGSAVNWSVNQNNGYYPYSTPTLSNNVLTLTDGAGGETRSLFFNSPQYIGAFQAAFTYQTGGNKAADGVSFCLQNDPRGPAALGGGGGQLGVGTGSPISPSVELELDLYNYVGYGFNTNGVTGAYVTPGGVNIQSGDPISVTLNYANPQLTVTFTDAVTKASFLTNLIVGDLTQLLGANSAYVGFTGADGGSTSIQTISNFSFLSLPPAAIQMAGSNVLLSWSGAAPGYTLQQNSDLTTSNWVAVTNQDFLLNGSNQVTVPPNGSNEFYRLVLP